MQVNLSQNLDLFKFKNIKTNTVTNVFQKTYTPVAFKGTVQDSTTFQDEDIDIMRQKTQLQQKLDQKNT